MMASDRRLTAVEWYDFFIHEVKLPRSANDEIELLAIALEYHYMTKEDFINLSANDLESKFKFERQGLLNQITKWKKSFTGATAPTGTINSPSNNNNESHPLLQENPLHSLVSVLSTPLNTNQVTSFMENCTQNVSQIGANYLEAVNVMETFGNNMVVEGDRVYYRCKVCSERVWVAKEMSAFVEFPGCFSCQRQWLTSLLGFSRRN